MMFNLGRVLIFYILIVNVLYANVELKAPKNFYTGDSVVFELVASGENIEFPDITTINGLSVQNAGSSSSTRIINGTRSQSISKRFVIYPKKTFTIPALSVKVNGKVVKTDPVTIKQLQVTQTKSDLYSLQIKTDKTDIKLAQQIKVDLIFKYKKDLNIASLDFSQPVFENFWVKKLQDSKPYVENEYVIQKLSWLLFPQKTGKLTIDPLKIIINTIDNRYGSYSFFSSGATRSTPVYSNSLEFNVESLPNNLKLLGDFSIQAEVDKSKVKENEAVSFKVTIRGSGNMDDLEDFMLDIPNATIYDNPAVKNFKLENGTYGGTFEKTFSIISSNDFIIEPITIEFVDSKSNKVKVIKTQRYEIEVQNVNKEKKKLQISQEVQPSKDKIEQNGSTSSLALNEKLFYFTLGVIITILIYLLYKLINPFINFKEKKSESTLEHKIKKASSCDELLNILSIYIKFDQQLDKIIFSLENKKDSQDIKKLKKEILTIIKDEKFNLKH